MAKRNFTAPMVVLATGWGGDGEETGGGSGGSSPDTTLVDFFEWEEMYGEDLTGDGNIDIADYSKWWVDNGYSSDDWDILNPDLPNPYNG